MSAELTRLRTEGWRQAVTIDGIKFTVNSGTTEYDGVLSSGDELKMLASGGFVTDFDKALDFLPSEIALVVGDKIVTGGKTYRVLSIAADGEPISTATLGGIDK